MSDGDIRAFSTCLRDSRKVFVLGCGHFAALSSLITLRLNRSGYEAVDLAGNTLHLAEILSTMTEKDAVWLHAFRRATTLLQDVRDVAA
ncbi:hypothetical protein ABUK73_22315 [Agrobacterium sp. BA1120]|uniref:hypothetical protein n=1 Tax=Agrobacterium sp. BA1120 TaxID=3228927 RepID=UPI003369F65B